MISGASATFAGMRDTRRAPGNGVGVQGRGRTSFKQSKEKVNTRQPCGEGEWVRGDTGGSVEVGVETDVSAVSLESAVEDVGEREHLGEMNGEKDVFQLSKHLPRAKSV